MKINYYLIAGQFVSTDTIESSKEYNKNKPSKYVQNKSINVPNYIGYEGVTQC